MAQNITLLGASYSDVPAVELPKTGGGTAKYIDITDTTATASDVAQGKYFYTADGEKAEGTASGGGGGSDDEEPLKDVDFIDYDGTLLYSYTAEDFLAMTEMPPNPSHEGLIAQGWNWDLADAKEMVEECGFHVIGQNYTTYDGKTRIYLHMSEADTLEPQNLNIYLLQNSVITIDWGDGTVETKSTAGKNVRANHTYATRGDYVIVIDKVSGEGFLLGYWGTNQGLVWNNSGLSRDSIKRLVKIECGDSVLGSRDNVFANAGNLKAISFSLAFGTYQHVVNFSEQSQLKGIVLPKGAGGIGGSARCARYLSLPKSLTSMGANGYWSGVQKLVIPNSVTSHVQYSLRGVFAIRRLHLSTGVTEYPSDFFDSNVGLEEVTIPSVVTSINGKMFSNTRLSRIYLKPTEPPTLSNTNAFPNTDTETVFYVPYSADHSILEAYQSATNWSSFASKMQEEPQ